MLVNAYLNFDGNCGEAFRVYERVLGGKITFLQTFGDSPMESAPEQKNHVMHVRLEVDGQVLMGSDTPGEHFTRPQGFAMALHPEEPARARQIFDALAEGGTVSMPLQQTFWAPLFGMLVDRFGTPWMVNCDKAE